MSDIIDAKSQRGSALLAEIRKRYPNYHPVIAMVDIAHHAEAPLELQYNCHKTVAKYIEPELKNVEVKQELRQMSTVRVSMFEDASDVKFVEGNSANILPPVVATPTIETLVQVWDDGV